MKRILLLVRSCAFVGVLLTGCADLSTSPSWDASFGTSVARITAMQTLNPAGSAPMATDAGMDAAAAVNAQNNYLKSYSTPAKSGGASLLGGG